MSERTDPTRQAAQRLLGLAGPYRGETFEADHDADVRLVAEAVMERNNQSIIGARSAENAETCASDEGAMADSVVRLTRAYVRADADRGDLARDAVALQAEVVRLREALEGLADTADWYRRCLEDVNDRRPVRGLDETRAGYDTAYEAARAALKEDA